LKIKSQSIVFKQLEDLRFQVDYLTDRILRVKIYDPKEERYQVPTSLLEEWPLLKLNPREEDESKRKYEVFLDKNKENFAFSVVRKETHAKM